MNWVDKVRIIRILLRQMYDHAIENGLDHWKSEEAAVTVGWPNYFDVLYDQDEPTQVEIYSYVFGPNRVHQFHSVDVALDVVRQWHKTEMERVGW